MKLLNPSDESASDPEVTYSDQQSINLFSRLTTLQDELDEEIAKLKEEKEGFEDLSTELELMDEDEEDVDYKVGVTFVKMKVGQALERVKEEEEKLDERIEKLTKERDEHLEKMQGLKSVLYAKFGRSINLERSD